MPVRNYIPKAMLSQEVDVSEFAGTTLFTYGGGDEVNAPADWSKFASIFELLGYGVPEGYTLEDELNTADASFEWAVTIGAHTDHVRIEAIKDFYVYGIHSSISNDGAVFGEADSIDRHATLTAGVYWVEFTYEWHHGVIDLVREVGVSTLTFRDGALNTVLAWYPEPGHYQGALTLLRTGRNDDLLGLMEAASVGVEHRFIYGTQVQSEAYGADPRYNLEFYPGRVVFETDADALAWGNTAFRDALGFTGDEVSTELPGYFGGSRYAFVATYPPKWAVYLNRAIPQYTPVSKVNAGPLTITNGGHTERTTFSTQRHWDFSIQVAGALTSEDQLFPFIEWFERNYRVRFMDLMPDAMEQRLAQGVRSGYSLTHTGEDDYRVGVIRLVLTTGQEELAHESVEPFRRRAYAYSLTGIEYREAT